jgi:hypothetical protein
LAFTRCVRRPPALCHARAAGRLSFAQFPTVVRELPDALAVKTRLSAPVNALVLGHRDPFELALTAYVGLECRKHGQHAKECTASSGQGVDILLDDLQVRTCLLDLVGDVGKIAQGATEAVETRHNKRITSAEN